MEIINTGFALLEGITLGSDNFQVTVTKPEKSEEYKVEVESFESDPDSGVVNFRPIHIPFIGDALDIILSSRAWTWSLLIWQIVVLVLANKKVEGYINSILPKGPQTHVSHTADAILLAIIVVDVALLIIFATPLLRKVFGYHSVEHRVINCIMQDVTLTAQNVRAMTDFSIHCGSFLAIFAIPICSLGLHLLPNLPALVVPLSLSIAIEIVRLINRREHPLAVTVASFIQKGVCWTPTDKQIELGIVAGKKLLELENSRVNR